MGEPKKEKPLVELLTEELLKQGVFRPNEDVLGRRNLALDSRVPRDQGFLRDVIMGLPGEAIPRDLPVFDRNKLEQNPDAPLGITTTEFQKLTAKQKRKMLEGALIKRFARQI